MKQLVKLPELVDEFDKRDVRILAISNEEENMAQHTKIESHFGGRAPFAHAPDYGGKRTMAYGRTTAYLVDGEGIVRQVFPMEIYERPAWWSLLNEIDDVLRK